MNRNTKKGFTIVELIIVIAVIAVLAAVLIPTFSNLINQAQQAKDTALVSDLNKGLKMSGKEFDTMHDALTAVEENVGINVAKINAVATDSEILWDSVNQCFVYLKGGETTPTYIPDSKSKDVNGQYDYWQIVKAPRTDNKYSQYISGTDYTADVAVSTGLDVGDNTGIKNVTYSHTGTAQSVVVRTDGGKLTVNAATDTLKRYGTADSVQITAIAPQSYHEYGTVIGNIELASGRVVMESGSTAAAIKITAEADKIADGTATIAVDNKTSNVSVVVPADVKTAIDNSKDSKNTLPTTNVISDSTVIDNMSKFAGGLGTEASPYLINNGAQLKKIISGKFYRLISDIETNASNYHHIQNDLYSVVLDGDGHKISSSGPYWIFKSLTSTTLKNITFELDDVMVCKESRFSRFENIILNGSAKSLDGNWGMLVCYPYTSVEIVNCINNANCTGTSYNGVFCGFIPNGSQNIVLKFENCVNNGTFVSEKAAIFLGNNGGTGTKIIANNCKNNAVIRGTSVAKDYSANIVVGVNAADAVIDGVSYAKEKLADIALPGNGAIVKGPEDASLKLTENADKTFTIIGSDNKNVDYYVVQVGIYASLPSNTGTSKVFATETIKSSALINKTASTNLKNYGFVDKTWAENNSTAIKSTLVGNAIITLNDNTYYYVECNLLGEEVTTDGNAMMSQIVTVLAYDVNGNLLASAALQK